MSVKAEFSARLRHGACAGLAARVWQVFSVSTEEQEGRGCDVREPRQVESAYERRIPGCDVVYGVSTI